MLKWIVMIEKNLNLMAYILELRFKTVRFARRPKSSGKLTKRF